MFIYPYIHIVYIRISYSLCSYILCSYNHVRSQQSSPVWSEYIISSQVKSSHIRSDPSGQSTAVISVQQRHLHSVLGLVLDHAFGHGHSHGLCGLHMSQASRLDRSPREVERVRLWAARVSTRGTRHCHCHWSRRSSLPLPQSARHKHARGQQLVQARQRHGPAGIAGDLARLDAHSVCVGRLAG